MAVLVGEIPPDTLLGGKIRLIQRIGRGGMGEVWVARNEATQAEVAVKTLVRAERTTVHDERFRREARLAATISHRNVVRIFDLIDDPDGTLGLVMELLRGGTLEACMRDRGALSSLHAVAVAVPILQALHYVHKKGIVHRDVKPANVFFAVEPDGHVIPKLLDFGIAKLPAAGSALTMDGSVLGTPRYMSPEQIRGQEELDGRSDTFSLAVVLYEMLTGVRVFQRDSAAGSLAAVLEHEVDPDPRIEPRLWVALSRALAKRPYERYATCGEFAEALRNAMDATDEDLAQSLQELRPKSELLPESGVQPALDASSNPGARRRRSKKGKKNDTLLYTLAAAGAASILAVVVTLSLSSSSSSGRSEAPSAPSGVTPAASAAGATTKAPRDDVPPPPPAVASAAASVTSAPADIEIISTAPATTSGPAGPKPSAATRTGATATRPVTTARPAGSGGKKGDVATRPDF